eukprot:UN16372
MKQVLNHIGLLKSELKVQGKWGQNLNCGQRG